MPPERVNKMSQGGKDLSAAKPERESITGDPWGQVQSINKKGGQAETGGGLGTQHGS